MEKSRSCCIVGMGNPGKPYVGTRHNIGREIVQSYAEARDFPFKRRLLINGHLAQGRKGERKVLVFVPGTYMNLSGDPIKKCLTAFHVPLEGLLVVCDDVALPIGKIRLRLQGSSGGHNGLKSVEGRLQTQNYARLKIGVGAPLGGQPLEDFVLERFPHEDRLKLEKVMVLASEVLELWSSGETDAAMRLAHGEI